MKIFNLDKFTLPFSDPILIFAVVLTAALVFPLLFRKLKLPPVIGLIFAGIVLGEHGTGLLRQGSIVQLLGTAGLLYIMFLAALELDLAQFFRAKFQTLLLGIMSFTIPFLLGNFAFAYFTDFGFKSRILISAIIGANTLVTYPIASRLGLSRNKAVTAMVGATIIADMLALGVVTLLAGTERQDTQGMYFLGLTTSVFIGITIILLVVPYISRFILRFLESENKAQFTYVLVALFLCAKIAELTHLEPIIGAFLAGLALNRLIPENSALMNRIFFVGNSIFIPAFLIYVGLILDIRVLGSSWGIWILSLTIMIPAFIGKYIAAFLAQKLFKFSYLERMTIFSLNTAEVAAALAAALIGYELKILPEAVLNAILILITISCVLSTYIMEIYGKKLALIEERDPFHEPEGVKKILVPIANPETIEKLIDLAILLKPQDSYEPIYPLTVVSDDNEAAERIQRNERILQNVVRYAAAADQKVELVSRIDVNAISGIVRAVRELLITEIIIGWNTRDYQKSRIFRSLLELLSAQTEKTLIVSKILTDFSFFRVIRVCVARYSHLDTGFSNWLTDIRNLARRLKVPVHIHAESETLYEIEKYFKSGKTRTQVYYHMYESSESLIPLKMVSQKNDLLFIVSGRSGSAFYYKQLEKYPYELSESFQEFSFLLVYPEITRTDFIRERSGYDFVRTVKNLFKRNKD